jgi:cytochrome c oxidase cbb3-type subunit 4
MPCASSEERTMDLEALYPLIRSLWVVWFFLLFGGILAWVLWPKNREKLESHANIPLRDEPPTR